MNQAVRTSPIVAIAAASVIVFSAVGTGVMTGLIPSSFSKPATQLAPAAPVALEAPHAAAPEATRPTSVQPVYKEPAPRAPRKAAPRPAPVPVPVAQPDSVWTEAPTTEARPSEPAMRIAAPATCVDCGVVRSVRTVEEKGPGTWMGAAAGGVAGGLLGSQIGSGKGRTIATVAGAVGGAFAGHQVEKHVRRTRHYEVAVRMEDGSQRTVSMESEPAFRAGDRVRVVDGELEAWNDRSPRAIPVVHHAQAY
jgi:outer membrane lipoprotein SlyB